MLMEGMITYCAATSREYSSPVMGAEVLRIGESGYFEVVLHLGPEYVAEAGLDVWSEQRCADFAAKKDTYLNI